MGKGSVTAIGSRTMHIPSLDLRKGPKLIIISITRGNDGSADGGGGRDNSAATNRRYRSLTTTTTTTNTISITTTTSSSGRTDASSLL